MFNCIYGMRLQMVVILMLLLLLLWANLCQHINKKRWAAINAVIFDLSTATILYATVLTRSVGVSEAILAPFVSLTAGRWVYFSGLPCQIAALKSYLGRDYETLITQDTACHSVPSPLVWGEYKAELEKQHGGKLAAFSFRNKANGWEVYHIRALFDNGSEFTQPAAENPYQRGFIKGLYSRSSCFVCKFKGIERCSDVTLADYWGVKGIQPDDYNPQGTSLILLHSEKGRSLLECCKEQLRLQPAAKDAFAFNPAVLAPIQKPARYDEFWEGYGQTSFADLVSACCEPTEEELAQERRSKSLLARVMRRLKR